MERKPFRPFSNGSEGMDWMGRNCETCARINPESEDVCRGCPAETEFTLGAMITDEWPSDWALGYIGITVRDSGYPRMPDNCLHWTDQDSGENAPPKPKPVDPNQGNLFPDLEPKFGELAPELERQRLPL